MIGHDWDNQPLAHEVPYWMKHKYDNALMIIARYGAEVKRLDAIIRDIESLIPENPDYVCEEILGACHRYMYPEEFGEVIE